jgi:hypothetical protein
MKLSLFKPLLLVLVFSMLFFCVQYYSLVYLIGENAINTFCFSLVEIYLFFTISSILIVTTLIFVRKKNLDIVGYFYLILTMVKMGIAYFFLHQINQHTNDFLSYEKKSFFVSFILFLAIETLITIRLLNKNQ